MKMSKLIVAAAAATITAAALAACGGSEEAAPADAAAEETVTESASGCVLGEPDDSVTTEVRIAYQHIANGDLIVKEQQILENCLPNAVINWNLFSSGGDVLQAYGAGSIDIGLTGSNPAIKALSPPLIDSLPPLVNTWIFDVIGKGESLVVKPEITSAADLKGKQIATPFSSTAHYSLLKWLELNGLSETDVTLVNLEPEAMVAAWPDLAGVFVWSPALSEIVALGGVPLGSAEDTAAAGFPTYDLANGTKEFVDANTAFMDMWAKAQGYAVDMILNDPDAAAASIGAELAKPADEVKPLFEGYKYLTASEQASPDWLGGKLGQDFIGTADFLLTQGAVDGVSAPEVYEAGVTNQFAEAAAS